MNPNTEKQEPIISDDELKLPEDAMRATHAGGGESALPVVLGVIIVLLVLVLGGLYLWGSTLGPADPQPTDPAMRPTAEQNNEPESDTADAQVQALETVSTSNSLEAIEADIESTLLEAIDTELGTIEAEIEAGME